MRHDQVRALPAAFRRIRLELAREPGHPEGERGIGYTIVAPLNADGSLDVPAARTFRDDCSVIRFHDGREDQRGHLRRRPGGSWAFHYELPDDSEDDDPAYRLEEHRFAPGEYVTIIEDDGEHTYRVAAVEGI